MTDKLNIIGKLASYYSNTPVIRSLLQLVPSWGAADEFLQQRANEIRSERLRTFFDELAEGKYEITEDLIQSEDFLHFYFCTLRAVLNTRQREKIRLLARLLNSSLSPDISGTSDEYEELLSILESITFREFEVIYDLYNLELQHPRAGQEGDLQTTMRYWKAFKQIAFSKYGIAENTLSPFMAKLERTGLYLRITARLTNYPGDAGRTTPLLDRLLEFVREKEALRRIEWVAGLMYDGTPSLNRRFSHRYEPCRSFWCCTWHCLPVGGYVC